MTKRTDTVSRSSVLQTSYVCSHDQRRLCIQIDRIVSPFHRVFNLAFCFANTFLYHIYPRETRAVKGDADAVVQKTRPRDSRHLPTGITAKAEPQSSRASRARSLSSIHRAEKYRSAAAVFVLAALSGNSSLSSSARADGVFVLPPFPSIWILPQIDIIGMLSFPRFPATSRLGQAEAQVKIDNYADCKL